MKPKHDTGFKPAKFSTKIQKRREERKQMRHQKKLSRAQHYTKEIGAEQNKDLSSLNLQNKLIKKQKNEGNIKTSPVHKKKNLSHVQESTAFKMSANKAERLARLQDYVNRVSGKMQQDGISWRKCTSDGNVIKEASKPDLIKNKRKLEQLQRDQEGDKKEMNKLARLLHLRAYQKKKVAFDFADTFGDLLKDIEGGTLANAAKYKEKTVPNTTKDDVECDVQMAVGHFSAQDIASETSSSKNIHQDASESAMMEGKGLPQKKSSPAAVVDDSGTESLAAESGVGNAVLTTGKAKIKSSQLFLTTSSVEHAEHKAEKMGKRKKMEKVADDSDVESCNDFPANGSGDDGDDQKDQFSSTVCDNRSDENDSIFFDNEAEEDSEVEETSENEELEYNFMDDYKDMFEAGSRLRYNQKDVAIDEYSSNSGDDDDLEGFVVDDSYIEYDDSVDDELSDCENLSSDKGMSKENGKRRARVISSSSEDCTISGAYERQKKSFAVRSEGQESSNSQSAATSNAVSKVSQKHLDTNILTDQRKCSDRIKKLKKRKRNIVVMSPEELKMSGKDCMMKNSLLLEKTDLCQSTGQREKKKPKDKLSDKSLNIDSVISDSDVGSNENIAICEGYDKNSQHKDEQGLSKTADSSRSVESASASSEAVSIPKGQKRKHKIKPHQELSPEIKGIHAAEKVSTGQKVEGEKSRKKRHKPKREAMLPKAKLMIPDGGGRDDENFCNGDKTPKIVSAIDDEVALSASQLGTGKHKKSKKKRLIHDGNREKPDEGAIYQPEELNEEEELAEDIYGRLRDRQGNIKTFTDMNVASHSVGSYVPPALRKHTHLFSVDEEKKAELRELKRKLQGLINRLAESNLAGIASQIEGLYLSNSRNDMNETITKLMFDAVVLPVITPDRLIQEHALLIAVLTANIGTEVGAHILTEFVLRWYEQLSALQHDSYDEVGNKELDNLLLFIAYLYNFKVMDNCLLFDILQKLCESFSEKEVELILLVLRSVGFSLRKSNPLALKDFILKAQSLAASGSSSQTGNFSRVQFMLEILAAIRNNNIAKVPNYDPSHSEHLKTLLRGLVRKGCHLPELKISLDDILKSKTCGRWWLVGSAFSGGLTENRMQTEDPKMREIKNVLHVEFTEKFLKKAVKLQMSRPPRINILYIITQGSEDYFDACDKLLHLGLKPHEEIEIFNVVLMCCQKGKQYDPYFALLAARFCKINRNYQRFLMFALWDKFKILEDVKMKNISNISKFVAYLIGNKSLNLSVLKTISFMEVESKIISFIRQLLIQLLLHPAGTDTVHSVFSFLNASPKLNVLRHSLRVFIIKFIDQENTEQVENKQMLSNRIKMVLDILASDAGICL